MRRCVIASFLMKSRKCILIRRDPPFQDDTTDSGQNESTAPVLEDKPTEPDGMDAHLPFSGDFVPDALRELSELREADPEDELTLELIVKRKQRTPAAAAATTDSPLHEQAAAPPVTRSSAVRPSSGGIEMREQDPEVRYSQTYGQPPDEFQCAPAEQGGRLTLGVDGQGAPEAKPGNDDAA